MAAATSWSRSACGTTPPEPSSCKPPSPCTGWPIYSASGMAVRRRNLKARSLRTAYRRCTASRITRASPITSFKFSGSLARAVRSSTSRDRFCCRSTRPASPRRHSPTSVSPPADMAYPTRWYVPIDLLDDSGNLEGHGRNNSCDEDVYRCDCAARRTDDDSRVWHIGHRRNRLGPRRHRSAPFRRT